MFINTANPSPAHTFAEKKSSEPRKTNGGSPDHDPASYLLAFHLNLRLLDLCFRF